MIAVAAAFLICLALTAVAVAMLICLALTVLLCVTAPFGEETETGFRETDRDGNPL